MSLPPLYKAVLFVGLNLCLVYLVYINSSETSVQLQLPWRDIDDPGSEGGVLPPGGQSLPILPHGGAGDVDARPLGQDSSGVATPVPPPETDSKIKEKTGQETLSVKQVEIQLNNETLQLNKETLQLNTEMLQLNNETLQLNNETLQLNTTAVASTMDPDLEAALLDSSEIDLSDRVTMTLYSPGRKLQSLDDFNELMTSRVRKIQNNCQKIIDHQKQHPVLNRLSVLHSDVFYVLKQRDLIWCPVFKAASTNWMHNLLYLAGLSDKQVAEIKAKHERQPNDQARAVAPLISSKELMKLKNKDSSRRLIIVRHPFDRLVSAFRDKLERCHGPENCTLETAWYYNQYGKGIVRTYRAAAEARFSKDYFSERNNYGAPLPPQQTWRSADFPTWWEFVQYILETSPARYDEHWKPASIYCSVCAFPYNYILHFENIQQEEQLFAQKLGVENAITSRWENRNDEGLRKEDVVAKYFELLDDDDILALYAIYQDDFKMFGYQFQFRGLRLNMP